MSDTKHTPMVVAAARTMCRLESEGCGVDNDDLWKIYGTEFLNDAEKVVAATGAPALLEAAKNTLRRLEAEFPLVGPQEMLTAKADLRAAIAAATAPEQAK